MKTQLDIEEAEDKLMDLLLEQVIFFGTINGKQEIGICVNCNDVFAWGTSDAVPLTWTEVNRLYSMWKADHKWGSAKWCIMQREWLPQKPVLDTMKEEGAWDQELTDFFAEFVCVD